MMLGCKGLVTSDVRIRNMETLTHDSLWLDGLPLNISPCGGGRELWKLSAMWFFTQAKSISCEERSIKKWISFLGEDSKSDILPRQILCL